MCRNNDVPVSYRDNLGAAAVNFNRAPYHCKPRCTRLRTKNGPMRPQSASLARATCHSPRIPRRTPCGARSFVGVTQITPLHCETRRPLIYCPQPEVASRQKRCITQAYIQRMKDGEKEWARHAEEIKAGKRKNFAAHLEERGLIHDVVGYTLLSVVSQLAPDRKRGID